MHDRPVRIIIDTNLWISFLIGLKSSPTVRNILTDGSVSIVMTDIFVSGDKDLTDMHSFGHCQIMTLAEFKKKFL